MTSKPSRRRLRKPRRQPRPRRERVDESLYDPEKIAARREWAMEDRRR